MLVRAVCHLHSTWSYDGQWPLQKIVKVFSNLGIRVLLMTEHDDGFDNTRWNNYKEECRKLSNTRITIVPGIEYSDPTNTVHVLTWGDLPFLGSGLETITLLERVSKHNGVSVLAHPDSRCVWKLIDPSWLKYLNGIELWNRKSDGFAPSVQGIKLCDRNEKMASFVGLDFHSWKNFFPLYMKLGLNGMASEQVVLDSLNLGNCRPLAFGLPLSFFTHGLGLIFATGLDLVRKMVLRALSVFS